MNTPGNQIIYTDASVSHSNVRMFLNAVHGSTHPHKREKHHNRACWDYGVRSILPLHDDTLCLLDSLPLEPIQV